VKIAKWWGPALIYTNVGSRQFDLAPFQSEARFSSQEDMQRHVEESHAIEGSRQLLEGLEEQAK